MYDEKIEAWLDEEGNNGMTHRGDAFAAIRDTAIGADPEFNWTKLAAYLTAPREWRPFSIRADEREKIAAKARETAKTYIAARSKEHSTTAGWGASEALKTFADAIERGEE